MYRKSTLPQPRRAFLAENENSGAVNPPHYARYPMQPLDFILINGLGFAEGNVVKYVCRWKDKNGVEDLHKARRYLDALIETAITAHSGRIDG